MRRPSTSLLALLLAVAGAVVVVVATRQGVPRAASQQSLPALAVYEERAPHVLSQLETYAPSRTAQRGASAPPSQLAPLPAAAFNAPVASYRVFAGRQLGLMEISIGQLESSLAAGNRTGAQDAWREAFYRYLELGAVYLQGQIADLNRAIDGESGGLVGATGSARFAGLHRLELGLWTGSQLGSLLPWARLLAADVGKLRLALPGVPIAPLDYATRAHEILEDAVRDLLSGTDVPWSGEGVLGTAAGIAVTNEVITTLRPLLEGRENVLPVVYEQLANLQTAMATIKAAHGGHLPTNAELTQEQSEMLDGAIGGALEALAQVPGALETAPTPVIPQIPPSAERFDPVDP
jgi:high-affinity iron transporter